ncbi:SCO1860 family LAETG-anchored protein [Streptomyces sp. bgisy100]|uniref:SCO1860 family LAETG-anchored protein n=1 Tax=Streptomyces sp. bgisy100 TaxID=3413783 RepID=UPI003D71AF7F
MPARRAAAMLTATALAAGPAAVLGAAPAHATGGGGGKAGAVVLRTGLDVRLLNDSVHVPLNAALNEVQAPADADRTALAVRLDGVGRGRPVSVLRADAATARATADARRAKGYANLVRARVHVPGLPLLSLIEVEQVTSKAVCMAGHRPEAVSNVLGTVRVLGRKVTLSSGGTTRVRVPQVGEVRLDLSRTATTSRTAAATALALRVSVDPLKLNVAKVQGRVTLAEATCRSPHAGGSQGPGRPGERPDHEKPGAEKPGAERPGQEEPGAGQPGGAEKPGGGEPGAGKPGGGGKPAQGSTDGPRLSTQTGSGTERADAGDRPAGGNLAQTGGSSTTPYLAGGAALLVVAGGGALVLARRRRRG